MVYRIKPFFYKFTVGVTVFAVTFFVVQVGIAQSWTGPTEKPPAGNPPGFIYNQTAPTQTGSFIINGSGTLGTLIATTQICFGDTTPANCKSSWSTSDIWQLNGTNAYYNGGNVGIGTSSPSHLLHIKTTSGNAEFDIQTASHNYWALYHDNGTESLRFWNNDISGEKNTLTLTNAGSIGVGTTAPISRFNVHNPSTLTSATADWMADISRPLPQTPSGALIGLRIGYGTSLVYNGVPYYNRAVGIAAVPEASYGNDVDMALYTGGASAGEFSEKVRITSEGNVGIGNINPDRPLVIGNALPARFPVPEVVIGPKLGNDNSGIEFQTSQSSGAIGYSEIGGLAFGVNNINNDALRSLVLTRDGKAGIGFYGWGADALLPTKKLDIVINSYPETGNNTDGIRLRREDNQTGVSINSGNIHNWIDFVQGISFIPNTYNSLGNWVWGAANPSPVIFKIGTDKVAVGTQDPVTRFEVESTVADATEVPLITLDSDNWLPNSGSSIQFKNEGGGFLAAIAGVDDAGYDGRLEFRVSNDGITTNSPLTNSRTVMTIKQDGKVGIGDITPDDELDVEGDIRATGSICASDGAVCLGGSSSSVWSSLANTGNGSTTYITDNLNANNIVRMYNYGEVNVRTTTRDYAGYFYNIKGSGSTGVYAYGDYGVVAVGGTAGRFLGKVSIENGDLDVSGTTKISRGLDLSDIRSSGSLPTFKFLDTSYSPYNPTATLLNTDLVITKNSYAPTPALTVTGKAVINGTGETSPALSVTGNLVVSGSITGASKSFISDHPNDPTKIIKYTALESGESGTYTRGSAKLTNGQTTIQLPEHFALVTSDQGITVQVTPTSETAGLYVASKSKTKITVKEMNGGTGNTTFDYMVNGIRVGYEDEPVIVDREEIFPSSENLEEPIAENINSEGATGGENQFPSSSSQNLIENDDLVNEAGVDSGTNTVSSVENKETLKWWQKLGVILQKVFSGN